METKIGMDVDGLAKTIEDYKKLIIKKDVTDI